MISWILLLILLISCVCAGVLEVKVSQPLYQAEENDSVTLEWKFTPETDGSNNFLFIQCHLFADHRVSVLYHLHEGIEVPESQNEQFSGRVQCDRDVLREGRLRLHVSRLRTEDSGQYKCEVRTKQGWDADKCRLNVTATVAQEPHTTPTVSPEPESLKWWHIFLIAGAVIGVGIVAVVITRTCSRNQTSGNSSSKNESDAALGLVPAGSQGTQRKSLGSGRFDLCCRRERAAKKNPAGSGKY